MPRNEYLSVNCRYTCAEKRVRLQRRDAGRQESALLAEVDERRLSLEEFREEWKGSIPWGELG